MEQAHTPQLLLDYIDQPAFCVRDGRIVALNRGAGQRFIAEGTEISSLLISHQDAYEAFTEGLLYLRVCVEGTEYDATVTSTEQGHIFVLDTGLTDDALQAMALASAHLRNQLGSVMAQAKDRLTDPEQDGGIMRGLYRLQRMLCNMSDTPLYRAKAAPSQMLELGSAVYEITEKASTLLEKAGYKVEYTGIENSVFTTGDYEMLERAVFNLLSNAAKYSTAGSTLKVTLTASKRSATISVEDCGDGIEPNLYRTLFAKYQRQVSVEDGRSGIGLGMALVQSVAAHHGGTVLVTQNPGGGTRVCMTLAIRESNGTELRSPIVRLSDYAGGNDHGLLELSDVLPAKMYLD